MTQIFAPLTWNADQTTVDARTRRTRIGVGWRNHLERNQAWAPIDTAVRTDRTVTAFPGRVAFPVDSQGWTDICIDGAFSMRRHSEEGDGSNVEPEFSMGMAVETQHNVTGHIGESNSSQMVYPGAWDSADLKLGIWRGRSARIEKVVEIKSTPAGDSEFVEYSFLLRSNQARVFAGPDHNVRPWSGSPGDAAEIDGSSVFLARSESLIRGAVLRTPVAWYYTPSGMIRVPVRVTFEILGDGETVRATKHIPRSLIATALAAGSHLFTDATFTPDASPETNSCDGLTLVANQSKSWTDLLTTAAGFVYDSDVEKELRCWAKVTTDKWDVLARGHLLFDTSSIGAGQQVDSASLDLSVDKTYFDEFDFYANIYSTSPASNTAIVTGDHTTLGTTPFATGIKITDMSTDWTTRTWTFNSDGCDAIDMESVSKFGIAINYDREHGTTGDPTWVMNDRSGFSIRFSENGTNQPTLEVLHSADAAPAYPAALLMV